METWNESLTYNFLYDLKSCNGCYFYNSKRIMDDKNYDYETSDGDGYRIEMKCDLCMSYKGTPLCIDRINEKEKIEFNRAINELSEKIKFHTLARIRYGKEKQMLEAIIDKTNKGE